MQKFIRNQAEPMTKERIKADLVQLGVKKGMILCVHSSLSSIGWVNGGAVAVIQALMETLTEEGTLVMPAQTLELSDPADWIDPPVPYSWWKSIKETMPAFDPAYTTPTAMGKVAETFWKYPGVARSTHPNFSFTAWGKRKHEILKHHALSYGLGENSPLGRMYDLDAQVLLIGTSFESHTAFHLAEYRISQQDLMIRGAPILENGWRVWKEYQDIMTREELFEQIGRDFLHSGYTHYRGQIGLANSYLLPVRGSVDYAEKWLEQYDQS
ncbi:MULTISPECIES: aminoglycoside N(3)-acetyltransferase [Bacillus]|uniref:Aminoglycoside N(3)-acetyltransferase n=1 Tax=Bacillus pumilus TaxID=1408 RepID=A0A2G8IXD8_BACPU|nr:MULTISPECIES: AAC(3) family N-acetyltransferase [Bacillus]MCC9089710.1 AAC(3) family N-acetyltransferase [Bacillus pumilus]MED1747624.1 AAC(3) family N-acetyltransferase [Bacillus zhangzhouensis]PIK28177.1 AAC(3) family N-acetyltransferase [Bacillus pumilus]UUD43087.1 AAC(3) family N-acetyltransferase [Bacillus pumilus]